MYEPLKPISEVLTSAVSIPPSSLPNIPAASNSNNVVSDRSIQTPNLSQQILNQQPGWWKFIGYSADKFLPSASSVGAISVAALAVSSYFWWSGTPTVFMGQVTGFDLALGCGVSLLALAAKKVGNDYKLLTERAKG